MRRSVYYISWHILAQHQLLWGHFFWTGFLGFHFVGDVCLKVLEWGVSVAEEEFDFQLTGIFLIWQLNPSSYVSLIPVQDFKESSKYEAAEGRFLVCTYTLHLYILQCILLFAIPLGMAVLDQSGAFKNV